MTRNQIIVNLQNIQNNFTPLLLNFIIIILLLLYKFLMHTMVDRKVVSEAQIITLDGTKPIGLAE